MDASNLAAALASGAGLAVLWLGLVWVSVAVAVRRGAAWPVLAGAALRLGLLALAGVVFVRAGGDAIDAVAALAGFVLVRTAAVALARGAPRGEPR
ncbi:hypothetical protein H0I76_10070 [Limibaculum sp. M0105]|uniref:Uncharacterized protein n=1 Tax=Thermohalobaculum xanthum TaxID=2753746 RepID=A0A8J7SDZ7_9RHOB|nr:hypothetical protein [Thermohalobaculum xanthum]MBK0399538.1 hypothetical protein [Thermohalobaculum xanthum]